MHAKGMPTIVLPRVACCHWPSAAMCRRGRRRRQGCLLPAGHEGYGGTWATDLASTSSICISAHSPGRLGQAAYFLVRCTISGHPDTHCSPGSHGLPGKLVLLQKCLIAVISKGWDCLCNQSEGVLQPDCHSSEKSLPQGKKFFRPAKSGLFSPVCAGSSVSHADPGPLCDRAAAGQKERTFSP